MPLPMHLVKVALGHPLCVELKNGEVYNGHLKQCDDWMNLHLVGVVCTASDGERFWKMEECFVRGNTIKCLRVPPVLLPAAEEAAEKAKQAARKPNRKRPAGDDEGGEKRAKGGKGGKGAKGGKGKGGKGAR
eukprot:TRINITY_DN21287_c0_g1_i1.p4 TRINITY_DN21287_c0_g1~~TRINITY_DN21287_c0_g1_i1.p4  ORF type:complete len:132 (+),score=50.69 TRINITY_DN21287_c0_g1_i1:105-500(+)